MKTGRYRVRRSWLGKAILQQEFDGPSFIAGQVDASIRDIYWRDVKFDDLDTILVQLTVPGGPRLHDEVKS